MANISPAVAHHRARIAALSRDRAPDDVELLAEKQSLATERLAEHAVRVVSGWPAPTPEQLQRVAAILLTTGPDPGGVSADAA